MYELDSFPTPRRTSLPSMDNSTRVLLEDTEIRQFTTGRDSYSASPARHSSEVESLRAPSLQTVVALLATITRSMIGQVLESVLGQLKWRWYRSSAHPLYHLKLYDGASHGVWGSIQFNFWLFGLNLANIGAIITTLSLGIGVFTQQSLQTTPCLKEIENGKASMAFAQTSLTALVELGDTFALAPWGLAVELRAAFITGLSASRPNNTLSPVCSSGNCTFPTTNKISYATVGFSSACVDMSSMLSQSGPLSWDPTDLSWDPADPMAVTGRSINYSLSSELTLTYHLSPTYWSMSRNGGRWETMLAMSTLNSYGNLAQRALNQSLLNNTLKETPWQAIGLLVPTTSPCQDRGMYQKYLENQEDMAMPPVNTSSCPQLNMPNVTSFPGFFAVTAAVCFSYPSLRKLNGSIVSGEVLESLVSDPIPLRYAKFSIGNTTGWVGEVLDPCVIDGVFYTSANYSFAPGGLFDIRGHVAPQRCIYGFHDGWASALTSAGRLEKIMIGDTDSSTVKSDCSPYLGYSAMMCTEAWWLSAIYNGGHASIESIRNYMDSAFNSLNGQLRMLGTDWNGNPTNVSGTEYSTKVCVQFRAAWLIFPLCLVMGTLALLIAMVVSGFAQGQKEIIWKSSILPHLFYGVEDQYANVNSEIADVEELERAAQNMKADFSVADRGYRFRVISSKE
ncbi:hypothetical protein J7T55_002112 [Diaporthe amygdali]|uniref:uncharacterized protein n=1 Tax=Phomopsis amygdali TaxID=1214568 RepID=UPI0022FEB073|nr:uncharacterized protein J7T55_002112 [Diaporthe amygdali]KAJ0108508.1 hypothetical protein J7T55_002112 [Diaporthe amygdali]